MWTTPPTFAVGEVLDASTLNIITADLKLISGAVGNIVATTQTTASTSFATLSTAGPAVTLTTGAHALITVSARLYNSTAGKAAIMGTAISGATTRSATGTHALYNTGNGPLQMSYSYIATVTAGSNTFTAKFARGGAGGTAHFRNRSITVWGLP
jgi:hypothetical protein